MASDSPPYAPMLAGTAQTVPAGDAWRFEIKWDGFRAIARIDGDDVRLWSRNGKALEGKHRSVAEALPHALTHSECVLDGELCAFDETGVPRFELFQRGEGSIAYVVFGLGFGTVNPPITNTAVAGMPASQAGVAAAVLAGVTNGTGSVGATL